MRCRFGLEQAWRDGYKCGWWQLGFQWTAGMGDNDSGDCGFFGYIQCTFPLDEITMNNCHWRLEKKMIVHDFW